MGRSLAVLAGRLCNQLRALQLLGVLVRQQARGGDHVVQLGTHHAKVRRLARQRWYPGSSALITVVSDAFSCSIK
jgi:hypothetical protein